MKEYTNMWSMGTVSIYDIPDNAIGFVYILTHISGKRYIGKKGFYSTKIVQRNKKKKRILVESDWKHYYGSNLTIKDIIELEGVLVFSREILHICYSKSQCSYLEIKEQLIRDVILSEDYFNDWITCKITRRHMTKFQL